MIKSQGIYILDDDSIEFPPTAEALADPNGLLAVGGDLSAERLLNAYQHGIFPWFEEDQPILWWSPNPRCVLYPNQLKISKSLQKSIRKSKYQFRKNNAFKDVITACRETRIDTQGTWITEEMLEAYISLHKQGHAHSYEIWHEDKLVGGLYGLQLGAVFCGESMFSKEADTSKIALYHLCQNPEIQLIDCQLENPHLMSLGAENISRNEFKIYLNK